MRWLLELWPWIAFFVAAFALMIYVNATRPIHVLAMSRRRFDQAVNQPGLFGSALDARTYFLPRPTEVVRVGEANGNRYEVHRGEMGDSAQIFVHLVYDASSTGAMMVVKLAAPRTRLHALLKRFGIQYHRFGDGDIDRAYDFFVGYSDDGLRLALQSPTARKAMKALLHTGATLVQKDAVGFGVVWGDCAADGILDEGTHAVALAALGELADACADARRAAAIQNWQPGGIGDLGPGQNIGVALLVAMMVPLVSALWVMGKYQPLNVEVGDAFAWVCPITAVLAVPGLLWLRRARRRRPFGRLVGVFGIGAILAGSCGTALFLVLGVNGALDRGSERSTVAPIVEIDSRPGVEGGTEACTARVMSWTKPNQAEPFTIHCDDYAAMAVMYAERQQYPALVVTTKPGFLGIELLIEWDIDWDYEMEGVAANPDNP